MLKYCNDSEILHQPSHSNGGVACKKLKSYTENCGGGVGTYLVWLNNLKDIVPRAVKGSKVSEKIDLSEGI